MVFEWNSDLGFETRISQSDGVDLVLSQTNSSGREKFLSFYSNPGFLLFSRLVEAAKISGQELEKRVIFEGDCCGVNCNFKDFDNLYFKGIFASLIIAPLVNGMDVFCGRSLYGKSYLFSIDGERYKIFLEDSPRDEVILGPNDLTIACREIYRQYSHQGFRDIYDMVIGES
jgi:hypothetical protein